MDNKYTSHFKGELQYHLYNSEDLPIVINIDPALQELLTIANTTLGKLEGYIEQISNIDDIIQMFISKEAIQSNKIAGNEVSLIEYIKAYIDKENPNQNHKINKISNYIKAINYGYKLLESLPLSINLVKELNKIMLFGTRKINESINQIVDTENSSQAQKQLDRLDSFIHESSQFPLLIKAGLLYGHFASLNLYTETQGKINRLFSSLYLQNSGIVSQPILYLSEYFYNYKKDYITTLKTFHDPASKERWLKFFIYGIIISANSSINALREIITMQQEDMQKVQSLGRTSEKGIRLLKALYKQPLVRVKDVENITILKNPNALGLISKLVKSNILQEMTGQRRNRVFGYLKYMQLFN